MLGHAQSILRNDESSISQEGLQLRSLFLVGRQMFIEVSKLLLNFMCAFRHIRACSNYLK